MAKRVIWIVLDSAGIGEEPDADKFGDVGSDTFGHILETYPDAKFDNLTKLGLRAIENTSFYDAATKQDVIGVYGKAQELSNGKDTTTGHWEMIGIHTKHAFPTYPNGFPQEIIDAFIEQTGCGAIYGNKVASGIPIIAEYGEEHMKTGYPIVYTSADSVFQIAASEEKVGLPRLYEMCEIARKILVGEHGVGRVIARPFVRKGDGFERTSNRRDYALEPSERNALVHLADAGVRVCGVGKISDIFHGSGICDSVHTTGNTDGMQKTLDYMQTEPAGLIFTNLVDFDMKYGHRRDTLGYKNALEEFDAWLPKLYAQMTDEDILIVDADHGCDPTFKGTDHTREYIPILMYGKGLKQGTDLGTRPTFADIGKTVEEYLLGSCVDDEKAIGKSFLQDIM